MSNHFLLLAFGVILFTSKVFSSENVLQIEKNDNTISEEEITPNSEITDTVNHEPEPECSDESCGKVEAATEEGEAEASSATDAELHLPNITSNTSDTSNNGTDSSSVASKKVECSNSVLEDPVEETDSPSVKIVNGSQLTALLVHNPNITSRSTVAPCALVYFYAFWCHHSARAAPHMNALPRAFPSIPVYATDSMKHHSVNTQHGIMAVPTLMLFHNGRPVSRFNDSDYNLNAFANFITRNTGLESVCLLNVTSKDYVGPLLPLVQSERDYTLMLAWTFLICASIYLIVKTQFWRSAVERFLVRWREQDIAHEHAE